MEFLPLLIIIVLISQIISAIALLLYSRFKRVANLMGLYLIGMLINVILLFFAFPFTYMLRSDVLLFVFLFGVPLALFCLHIYALCLSAHLKKKSVAKAETPEHIASNAAQ